MYKSVYDLSPRRNGRIKTIVFLPVTKRKPGNIARYYRPRTNTRRYYTRAL